MVQDGNGNWREGKNFGLNNNDRCFGCQDGALSRVMNNVPGMNALATLHDAWMNNLQGPMAAWQNYGTMLPAALVSYLALLQQNNLLQQLRQIHNEGR
jgi:filamentous hemagglutinin